LGGSVTAGIGA
jgi:hypothetical protein